MFSDKSLGYYERLRILDDFGDKETSGWYYWSV